MGEKKLVEDGLMTIEEVAEYLKFTVRQVRFYIQTNEIPSYKIGKHRRFSREKVMKWLNSKED